MIRYALRCAEGHAFDSWFQSADAYDTLAGRGLVSCAVCGGREVSKAMMAPRVASGEAGPDAAPGAAPPPARPLSAPAHPAEQMLKALRARVEATSTYVGPRFAAEARAMHEGTRDAGVIHGEASLEEARALLEDGIPVAPLPPGFGPKRN